MRDETDHRDSAEIPRDVERVRRHQRRVGHRQDRREHQRVAIGWLARHFAEADDAATTRFVVNDDRLAQRCAHAFTDGPGHQVGRATGSKRHDDTHRFGWKISRGLGLR